jgi:hypothetical protein
MNKNILRAFGFEKEVKQVEAGICPTCGKRVDTDGFRDILSQQEFKITGTCQLCQDELFKGDDD